MEFTYEEESGTRIHQKDAEKGVFYKSWITAFSLTIFHPSVDKRFALIRTYGSTDNTTDTYQTIEEFREPCEACRTYSKRSLTFRVSLSPERIYFNHEGSIDLVGLEETRVLHITHLHTHYQNAIVTRSKRAEGIWSAFAEEWASLYVGYPNIIMLDEKVSLKSELLRDAAYAHGITLQFSSTQYHNSIWAGEWYLYPLRRIFKIARDKYPSLDP